MSERSELNLPFLDSLFSDRLGLSKIHNIIKFLRKFDYVKQAGAMIGVKMQGNHFLQIIDIIRDSDSGTARTLLELAVKLMLADYGFDPEKPIDLKEYAEILVNRYRCGCKIPEARIFGGKPDTYPEFHEACQLKITVHCNFDGIAGILPSKAKELWMETWKAYETKFNLKFYDVSQPSQAMIYAYVGPADRNVLAWMEMFDGCSGQHESRYNKDVMWTQDLFFGTGLHENAHGLGIDHSPAGVRSIMGPVMDPTIPNVIDAWLTSKLVIRYGERIETPHDPSPTQPDPVPSDPQPPVDNGGPKVSVPWEDILAIIVGLIQQCQSKEEAFRTMRFRKLRAMSLVERQLRRSGYNKDQRQYVLEQVRLEMDNSSEDELKQQIDEAWADKAA